ncbi:MAG TPA: glycoside hydrolase family 88 protein, partial [Chitinophagaceae bacterium]|nr:glycoside hydrolase family 88 protein [Chitinophagaceae bacterium]
EFIETGASGQTNLKGTVAVSGLGGNPYRDGSFDYYMSEPVVVNDPKGMGAFINCAVEMEMAPKKNTTVYLDYFFNNEWRKDATGTMVRYHYTWDDKANSGFSMLGDVFNRQGVQTSSLISAPTAANLRNASIYIIVDPDTKKETGNPNFIQQEHINAIADWVKGGGVLVLMGNDVNNAEFEHFNNLAAKFGLHFNEVNYHQVQGDQFEQGAFMIPEKHSIFKTAKKIYVKELATLNVSKPTDAVFKDGDKVIMAAVKYGKGTVFAIGDPWLYNEYVDGRKLPAEYDNYEAAADLVKWLTAQSAKR